MIVAYRVTLWQIKSMLGHVIRLDCILKQEDPAKFNEEQYISILWYIKNNKNYDTWLNQAPVSLVHIYLPCLKFHMRKIVPRSAVPFQARRNLPPEASVHLVHPGTHGSGGTSWWNRPGFHRRTLRSSLVMDLQWEYSRYILSKYM